MATVEKIALDILERGYIKKALATLIKVVERSRAKEIPGTEIFQLRDREIAALTDIARKL